MVRSRRCRLPLFLPILFAACSTVRSDPAAAHWRTVVAAPGISLRGLAVVDASTVWVGGSRGTLLRSTDGGLTFADVAPPDAGGSDFRSLCAAGPDEALAAVAGLPARVYRTTDGGRNWSVVHEDRRPAAFFDGLASLGDTRWLVGDPIGGHFVLLRSDDRGAHWCVLPGPLAEPGEAAFAASGTCLVAADGTLRLVTGGTVARLHTSLDGGATWTAVALPLPHGAESQGAFGLAVAGGSLVVVGGDYRAPAAAGRGAARSVDGGGTWAPVDALGYRSSACWIDPDHVLAVGEIGGSLSADGGLTWAPFGEASFHAVAAARGGVVFACGSRGRVARLVPGR